MPCCNLVAVTGGEVLGDVEFSDSLITIEKILKEEDILKANDERLVKLSLERLLSLKLSVSGSTHNMVVNFQVFRSS